MKQKRYIIKQFINHSFVSKIDVYSNDEDIKILKELILLPKKDELVKEYYFCKLQLIDENNVKTYLDFAMSSNKSEKAIYVLLGRYYNLKVKKIITYHMSLNKSSYKKYLASVKKGQDYENFIYSMLIKKNYEVIHNSLELGVKDKGIDFIALKDDTAILIQCKNWDEMEIEHSHLKEFYANCQLYLSKNNLSKYRIKLLFLTSRNILSLSGKAFLNENKGLIEYHVIKLEENENFNLTHLSDISQKGHYHPNP